MKFKGRIVTSFIVLSINSIFIIHYYLRDGFISPLEYIGLPFMLMLAWWFGFQYDRAKFYSEKDALTEIYNRRFVESFFHKMKALTEHKGQMFAVLLLDVNDFKTINDTFGHKAGDEFLKGLADQLKKSVRGTDIVARLGGDEFMVLTPDIQKKENVDEMIVRIHQNLKDISANEFEVSVSIGTAFYPSDGKTFDDLLKVADKNMYEVKFQKKLSNYSHHQTFENKAQ